MANTPNFDPILAHIAEKLKKDIASLGDLLSQHQSLRNFGEHNRLLSEIQAGVRSIDVLGGKVDLSGTTVTATPPLRAPGPVLNKLPENPDAPVMGKVDLAALSKAIESEA